MVSHREELSSTPGPSSYTPLKIRSTKGGTFGKVSEHVLTLKARRTVIDKIEKSIDSSGITSARAHDKVRFKLSFGRAPREVDVTKCKFLCDMSQSEQIVVQTLLRKVYYEGETTFIELLLQTLYFPILRDQPRQGEPLSLQE